MEEAVIKRIPPHNERAERAVIGSMMMDEDAVLVGSELLQPEDFYYGQYRTIFQALLELYRKGVNMDLVMLQDRLEGAKLPVQYTGTEYLSGLLAEVPTSVHVKYYAEIVKENASLRKMLKVTEAIAVDCYGKNDTAEHILEGAEKSFFEILRKRGTGEFEAISQIALRTLDRIKDASEKKGMLTGLSSGFLDLDRNTAGFQKSDLILIAGRPAMGKTAFALNIAEYVMMNGGKVALFSLEMSKEQLVSRLVSMNSRVDAQKIKTGELTDAEWKKVVDSIREIGDAELFIDDVSGATVPEIRTKCRRQMLESGLDLIIIDYLQLMEGSGKRRNENRQQEISEITRSLKIMAKELQVPVIVLSQLSRAVEQRPDKRPVLSDLRESGAIEQDADIVMFLYRDDYYHENTKDRNVAEVIIAKHRNGPTGKVKLAWLPHITKFANLMA